MGTRAVIFDIAYTPYRLKNNATAAEREAHAKERVFYDMSGADNIYKYMTTESKQTGAESKRFTMLEYLQKSTGVFNQNGMLSKEEVKAMKKRAQTGEKVLWHGFISFNKENSNKIDSLEKCIALVGDMFGQFFKDVGFESDNMDLMCALHLDRPEHLHIHYCFWEKEAKVKNKRAAGYIYRKKGKIPFEAIEKMTERLNAYVLEEDFAQSRRERAKALYKRSDFTQAKARDIVTRYMKELAEKIPKEASFSYGSKDMIPFREDIDFIAEMLFMTNTEAFNADMEFREELEKKDKTVPKIMGKEYREKLKRDRIFKEYMTDAADISGVGSIETIERLKWDYKRRVGNIVLYSVQKLQSQTYKRNPKRKYKTNDKALKRRLAISARKVNGSLCELFSSVGSLFLPETQAYRNRLKEIEEEIQEMKAREEKEAVAAETKRSAYRDWCK